MINTKTNRNLITFIVLTLFLLDVKLMICVYHTKTLSSFFIPSYSTFCSSLKTFFMITLIPQHYCKLNFLSTWATKSCSGFCHVRIFTYLSVAKRKQAKLWYDMAKIQIKSEKLTLFGGKFSGHGAIWHHIVFCINPSHIPCLPIAWRRQRQHFSVVSLSCS